MSFGMSLSTCRNRISSAFLAALVPALLFVISESKIAPLPAIGLSVAFSGLMDMGIMNWKVVRLPIVMPQERLPESKFSEGCVGANIMERSAIVQQRSILTDGVVSVDYVAGTYSAQS
jgi:hypothetical protein